MENCSKRADLAELSTSKPVNIKFICKPDYETAGNEYEGIFEDRGLEIIAALEKNSGLKFLEEQIIAIVGGFERSFSGNRFKPMNLRASSHNKTATLMHELTHRLLMQYPGLLHEIKERFDLKDVHQVVDLIFYLAMVEVIGQEEADKRVESECSSKDPIYRKCWDWYRDPNTQELRSEILIFISQWQKQKTEERIE